MGFSPTAGRGRPRLDPDRTAGVPGPIPERHNSCGCRSRRGGEETFRFARDCAGGPREVPQRTAAAGRPRAHGQSASAPG